MVFLDRRPRADRWLQWKAGLFVVAAVLGLGGMYLEEDWLNAVAIALLAVGVLLRFRPGDSTDDPDDVEDPEDLEGPEDEVEG